MSTGMKILIGVSVVLAVVLIVLKTKQKQTPTYSFADLLTSIKAQIGIK